VARIIARFRTALRNYGVLGTTVVVWKNVIGRMNSLTAAGRQARRAEAEFDGDLGVETRGVISLSELAIDSGNKLSGHRYQATPPDEFLRILGTLAIDHARFVFIDIGSGKGRTLLLAARFPFKEVIGVEFARELHEVAERNIAAARAKGTRCERMRSICADAVEFELPEEPLILYFYHPFEEDVFFRMIERIEQSLSRAPRPAFIIYLNPVLRRLFDGRRSLVRVDEGERWCIYASASHPPRDSGAPSK